MTSLLLAALAGCDPRPVGPPVMPTTPPVEAAARPSKREEARVDVVAVGDLLMHGMVQRSAREADLVDDEGVSTNHGGFEVLFEAVADDVASADIAFANLETPVAPTTHKGTRSMVFNSPPVLLDALESTGFDVLSFANNHVYDQGRAGLVETLEILDAHPLQVVGAGETCAEASAARVVERDGLKLAFLAASDLFNDHLNAGDDAPCASVFDVETLLASAEAAREEGADLVVLSVHWGVEYENLPQERHVEAAHALIEGGIDVILGHHPHVLQPVEVLRTEDGRIGVVAYSLGNFISNQSRWYVDGVHKLSAGDTRDGLLLSFQVRKTDYGRRDGEHIVRTELAELVAHPLWTVNNYTTRSKDEPVYIRVVSMAEHLQQLRAEHAAATDDDEVVRLAKAVDHLERRWERIADIVGRDVLAAAPR